MKSNATTRIRSAAVFSAATLFLLTAWAQDAAMPARLTGKWSTVDGAANHTISATLDTATSRGTLTVLSNNSECSIREAPVAVAVAANKLLLTVDPTYQNPCRAEVSVELTKKSGSDEYEGELHQGGRAGVRFPILRVKMRP